MRVSKQQPCPVCGKHDWCLIYPNHVICMRVPSTQSKTFSDGSIGYIHSANTKPLVPLERAKPTPIINVAKIIKEWIAHTTKAHFMAMASNLGVSVGSLHQLGMVKAPYHSTYGFPMVDGNGSYTGIRLRAMDGKKWAVRGSHQGIFAPRCPSNATTLICEGPTDTAAALTIGFNAIGRPSCTGGIGDVQRMIRRSHIERAVLIADNDDPGLRGATMFCDHLPIPTAIVVLPCKDLREFVNSGGTKVLLESMIRHLIWRRK